MQYFVPKFLSPYPSQVVFFLSVAIYAIFLSAIFVFKGIVVNRKSSKLPYPIYFYFDFQTFEWQKRPFSKESSASIKDFFSRQIDNPSTLNMNLNPQSKYPVLSKDFQAFQVALEWLESL